MQKWGEIVAIQCNLGTTTPYQACKYGFQIPLHTFRFDFQNHVYFSRFEKRTNSKKTYKTPESSATISLEANKHFQFVIFCQFVSFFRNINQLRHWELSSSGEWRGKQCSLGEC